MAFWTYSQNNSGGYFITDLKNGVCETVIIEAENSKEAWEKLERIGDQVDGFWDYCSCCGERWSNWMDESDGRKEPEIYGINVYDCKAEFFREQCFVHYSNGLIKHFKFPRK